MDQAQGSSPSGTQVPWEQAWEARLALWAVGGGVAALSPQGLKPLRPSPSLPAQLPTHLPSLLTTHWSPRPPTSCLFLLTEALPRALWKIGLPSPGSCPLAAGVAPAHLHPRPLKAPEVGWEEVMGADVNGGRTFCGPPSCGSMYMRQLLSPHCSLELWGQIQARGRLGSWCVWR